MYRIAFFVTKIIFVVCTFRLETSVFFSKKKYTVNITTVLYVYVQDLNEGKKTQLSTNKIKKRARIYKRRTLV